MGVVLITGGAGGMGLATATIMGRDHTIVLSDVSAKRLDTAVADLTAAGIEAEARVCDITDRVAVDELVRYAADLGPLAAIVHTAGVSPQMGSPEFIVRVNALGTVHLTRAALRAAEPGFALVNVASIAGHLTPSALMPKKTFKMALGDAEEFAASLIGKASRGPSAMQAGTAYSMSKAFVIWYSARMAAVFGAKGARILSVSPGSIDTAMGRLEEASGAGKMVEFAALKRFGTAEEVAELLAFCAGPKASYLTGIDILIDGGTRAGVGLRKMLAMARSSR